jgi:hypothetical protein
LETLGGTDDANIVPHSTPKLIPVVGKYHALVRVASRSIDPNWQSHGLSPLSDDLVMGRGGAIVSEHHGFEERIRG